MSTRRSLTDAMDPARAAALHVTLGLDGPPPGAGEALPPFWHYAYFWEALPGAALGQDGHPRVGEFIPDMGFARRMWAGGVLTWEHPVSLGQVAEKRSLVERAEEKQGRSGRFAVVTLAHEVVQGGTVCLRERQSLIYRPEAGATASRAAPAARTDETVATTRKFTTTDLFRYSALTFNGHRIHYDRAYATDVEGYPGLVVHGPLLAQMLVQMAEGLLGGLRRFEFRATAPLFDFEPATFCARPEGDGLALWVRGPDGRQCMVANAV